MVERKASATQLGELVSVGEPPILPLRAKSVAPLFALNIHEELPELFDSTDEDLLDQTKSVKVVLGKREQYSFVFKLTVFLLSVLFGAAVGLMIVGGTRFS